MSYYSRVKLRIGGETTTVNADAKAASAIKESAKSGGVISEPELRSTVLPRLDDYKGLISAGERPLVRALEAARDGKEVSIDGRTIRLTEPAKNLFSTWAARLAGTSAVAPLAPAAFDAAVSKALRTWYAAEVERRIADIEAFDPETATTYSPALRAEDRARAQDPNAFQPWSKPGQAFSFRPDENLAWLHLGADADADFPLNSPTNEKIPRDAIAFIEFNYDPNYAGQQLTSWFAFDRRNGALLRFFDTQA